MSITLSLEAIREAITKVEEVEAMMIAIRKDRYTENPYDWSNRIEHTGDMLTGLNRELERREKRAYQEAITLAAALRANPIPGRATTAPDVTEE